MERTGGEQPSKRERAYSAGRQGLQVAGRVTGIVLKEGVLPFIMIVTAGTFLSVLFFFLTLEEGLLRCSEGTWPCVGGLALSLFFLAGPVAYFYLGKTYAIMATVFHLLTYAQIPLWSYFLRKSFEAARRKHGEISSGQFVRFARGYVRRLENMNWFMRQVMWGIMQAVPILEVLEETAQREDLEAYEPEELAQQIGPRLSEATADTLAGPDLILLLVAGGVQVGVGVLALWLI